MENEFPPDDEIIDLLEEIIDDVGAGSDPEMELWGEGENETKNEDPFITATLAELYASQGFLESALDIYQELLKKEPGNKEYEKRVSELKKAIAIQSKEEWGIADNPSELPESYAAEKRHEVVSDGRNILAVLEKWLGNHPEEAFMPLKDILKAMVNDVDGALGAVVMGYDGIAMDDYIKDGSKMDLQLLTAGYAAVLKEVKRTAEVLKSGVLREVSINTEFSTAIAKVINDDFFIFLVMAVDGNCGKARFYLRRDMQKLAVALQ